MCTCVWGSVGGGDWEKKKAGNIKTQNIDLTFKRCDGNTYDSVEFLLNIATENRSG